MPPLVSVVTPVLDRVETIRACVAAVAAQTHPRFEHIVVDGGSTDGTVEVLEELSDPHELRWVSGPDGGMYDAINRGLEMASGDVLTYLNSDDLWFPWTLEVAVEALSAGADLCYGDMALLDRRGRSSSVWLQFTRPFDLNYYTHVAAIGQPTVAWRRQVTDRLGPFDDSYRLIGDCEYWLRAAVAGFRLEHIDEVQAVQVEHGGTLRATQSERLRDEFSRLRREYRDVAGPPGSAVLQRIRRSLEWRWKQLQLRIEIAREHPTRWPRFIGFLRSRGIEVERARLLEMQLPEVLRSDRAGWIDPERFESELAAVLGAR